MNVRNRVLSLLGVLVLCFVAVACGNGGTPAAEETAAEATPPGATGTATTQETAAEAIPIRVSSLAFPSLVAVIPPIIQDQGLDEANGLDLSVEVFGDIGAFYAATTNGTVDASVGGPNVLQRLALEGADIQIVATYVGLEPLVVVTANPEIESVEDLAGRSLAATVASAEFQALAIYARSKGVDLTSDATLVNASLADVRSQLEAGRVDAGMLWEPAASLALADNPDYRIIFNGDEAWRELTGERGWELVWAMQRSLIEQDPDVVDRWIATVQDAVDWLFDNPEEAAALMEEATGMPADAFVNVLEQGRVDYEVRPAWEEEVAASLRTHFEEAVDAGFIEQLPPDDIIYEPQG